MRVLSQANRESEKAIFTKVLWILVLGYFTYHLLEGERGLLAMMRLQADLRYSEAQLTELQDTRKSMEKHVQLLRPSHIDRDMLDEQARATLGYAKPGEIMILLPSESEPESALPGQ